MKVKEAIEKINSARCYSIGEAEDLLEGEYELVAENLDISKHRWYETSISVYKLEDGYIGIWGLSDIRSEIGMSDDFDILCNAEEYVEIPIISYGPKQ